MQRIKSLLLGTWRYFTSMSLGLTLLCLLIVFSVIGTFNIGMFASPWFLTVSALLTVNMLACTARRINALREKETGVPAILSQEGRHRFLSLKNCPSDKAAQEASAELRRLGFRIQERQVQAGRLLTGKKNPWAVLGSPLLHLAMVLVIAGSVVGGAWSHSQFYQVEVPGQAKLTRDGFPFDLNVKKFTVDTYEDGTARQYTSLVEVISANQGKLEKAVSVNKPLHYEGTKVYQTSFGYYLQGAVRQENRSFDFKVEEGEKIFLGGPAQLELGVEWPRYFIFSRGLPFTMGIAELGEPIKLLDMEVVFTDRTTYTGLDVKKDPGLPLIWAGFILFLMALPLRLYVRPQEIWLLLSQSAAGTEVRLAAQHRIKGKEQEEQLVQKLSGITRKERSLHS